MRQKENEVVLSEEEFATLWLLGLGESVRASPEGWNVETTGQSVPHVDGLLLRGLATESTVRGIRHGAISPKGTAYLHERCEAATARSASRFTDLWKTSG